MMKKREKKKNREHLENFSIAGFTYYDGTVAFKELEIGALLELELEEDNAYDPRAVMVWYKDYHLGYIPRACNRIFYKLLKIGITNIECRIQRISSDEHPENQVQVVAWLVKEKNKKGGVI